jgi:hypothetical protein
MLGVIAQKQQHTAVKWREGDQAAHSSRFLGAGKAEQPLRYRCGIISDQQEDLCTINVVSR